MRWKIIVVNAGIVVVVSLLTYVLLVTALGGVLSDPTTRRAEVEHAIRSGSAQLALDGLQLERWLSAQAEQEAVRGVYSGGTAEARSDSATAQANRIYDAAVADARFAKMAPALVLFVDRQGAAMGRNGSNLMRGDAIAQLYPSILKAMESGQTASAIWMNSDRHEQMFASYAPVRAEDGGVLGLLVVGTPLNDGRLSRTSELTSGRPLMVGLQQGEGALELLAHGGPVPPGLLAAVGHESVKSAAQGTLRLGKFLVIEGASDDYVVGAAPLPGYGAARAVLIAGVPASLVPSLAGVLWPVFGVALLGVLLVVAGGSLLGNYISRPISELEEGLLAVINGKTDHRFQLEHPELGGLVFRINSLLNALMGVPETDEEGRTSQAPQAYHDGP